jgi:hypothetical protein
MLGNLTSRWVLVSLTLFAALASAQTPDLSTVASRFSVSSVAPDESGAAGPAATPEVPVADPQLSPANILEDGPRDVGTKVDPTVCASRPLPDDVVAQCRRWLLIADASQRSPTRADAFDTDLSMRYGSA